MKLISHCLEFQHMVLNGFNSHVIPRNPSKPVGRLEVYRSQLFLKVGGCTCGTVCLTYHLQFAAQPRPELYDDSTLSYERNKGTITRMEFLTLRVQFFLELKGGTIVINNLLAHMTHLFCEEKQMVMIPQTCHL